MSQNPHRILLAACGDIGRRLAGQLQAAGAPVELWGLRRRPELLPAGIRPLGGDLSRPETLGEWPQFAAVVATAVPSAAAGAGPAAADRAERYRTGCLHSAAGLTKQLHHRRQKPFVFWVSSTAVYAGLPPGDSLDEQTSPQPADATGEVLLQAEQVVERSELPCCIVRPAGIYGPGRYTLVRQAGRPPATEPPTAAGGPGNRIHSEDVAGALAHLLLRLLDGKRAPPCLLLSDGNPVPSGEIVAWLRRRMAAEGFSPPGPEAPGAAGHRSGSRRGGRRGTASPVSNRLLLQSGYRLQYPDWQKGYGDLLAQWMQLSAAGGS